MDNEKKVLIAGFAGIIFRSADDTTETALKGAGFEIWTMNDWWNRLWWLDNPDKVFQIHCDEKGQWEFPDSWYDGTRSGRQWRCKYNKSGAEIITIIDDPELKRYRKFPREYILKYGFSYFASSVNYMMAMAIEEGYTTISIQDCAMFGDDEYKEQLPALIYAIRCAREKNIRIICPFESVWRHAGLDLENAVPIPRSVPYGMNKNVYNLEI